LRSQTFGTRAWCQLCASGTDRRLRPPV